MNPTSPGKNTLQRLAIGGFFTAMVWIFYLVRLIWGVGVMRDRAGNPAPVAHYLLGAIAITIISAAWVLVGLAFNKQR